MLVADPHRATSPGGAVAVLELHCVDGQMAESRPDRQPAVPPHDANVLAGRVQPVGAQHGAAGSPPPAQRVGCRLWIASSIWRPAAQRRNLVERSERDGRSWLPWSGSSLSVPALPGASPESPPIFQRRRTRPASLSVDARNTGQSGRSRTRAVPIICRHQPGLARPASRQQSPPRKAVVPRLVSAG